MLPKNAQYAVASASVPMVKLRPLNSLRSTTGCSSYHSQITKKTKPTAATIASATICRLANQSSSSPLSSMICSAATQATSRPRPTASIGSLRTGDSRWR